MHAPVLAAVVVAALGVLYTFLQRRTSPLSRIPGPWYAQWTAAVLTYEWLRGRQAMYIEGLHQKYGRVVRVGPQRVDFSSISGAKKIHSYNRPFTKTAMYDLFRSSNGAPSIFSTRDLETHARFRRLLSGAISESSLKDVEHVVYERAQLVIEKIGQEMEQRGAADVMKWWLFFSTDVIGELTFGDSFRMLERGRMNRYVDDLQKIGGHVGIRVAFPTIIRLASYLPIPKFSEAFLATQRMRSYAEQSIDRYEALIAETPLDQKKTLFTKIFQADMSRPEIVANAQTYIFAGSDTTATTLTYLIWAVSRTEPVRVRLLEELQSLPEDYSDADLKALSYLNLVIQETLRCYAAAPGLLPRDTPAAGFEIDGYWIPGGTTVQTQAYSMHRDPVVYPDPERFDPSRWESASKDMHDAWMPFGGGARVCIGLHLAKMELRTATAMFFRRFPNAKVSTKEGFQESDMESTVYFLMYPKEKRCLIERGGGVGL